METPDYETRLTLLERAQILHDATLRRHGEMLDRHEESRIRHEQQMARMLELLDQQQRMQAQLMTIHQAILDLLRRDNGH